MSLSKDFKEFIACLHAANVDYLLVGGYAVAIHGRPRFTKDIDFFVHATPENARRVMAALEAFGFGGLGLDVADFASPGPVIQLGLPPNRIDLLTRISGVRFEDAGPRGIVRDYDGLPLRVISLDDLIVNKRATNRPQDGLDLADLLAARAPDE